MAPLLVQRGQRVVVQSGRGLELGVVLCLATPQHRRLLGRLVGGRLLRQATPADEQSARAARRQAQAVVAAAQRFVAGHDWPVTILDLELFLDGCQGIMQYLGPPENELAPLVQALTHEFALVLRLENLAAPALMGSQPSGRGCCGGSGCASGCCWWGYDQATCFAPGCWEGGVSRRWSLL